MKKSVSTYCLLALLALGRIAIAAEPDDDHESAFKFRFVGPKVGNRIAAVAGIAGDPSTYYAGAASGGVFKSVDGGNRWEPIFDKQSAAAIGALAVAPSEPNTVWAGTGEAWAIRDSDVMGNGIYKSLDAGKNLDQHGAAAFGAYRADHRAPLQSRRRVRLRVGTHDRPSAGARRLPDHRWRSALGARAVRGREHGLFGVVHGSAQSAHPDCRHVAGGNAHLGRTQRRPRQRHLHFTRRRHHWTRIEEHGLPKSPLGKIDVAIAPTNARRMYALIQTKDQGSVWRSDDGGEKWKRVNSQRALIGRAGYYIRLAVSPSNDNEVLVANSSFWQSLDGGENFHEVRWGGDTHDIWIDPVNSDRFVITDDAGLIITTVHGRGFHRVTLPIGQMYHVAVDDQIPYYFYSNMQDDGNMRGPSVPFDSRETGWDRHMGGCESGFTIPDTTDPNIVWATCYGDSVTRWDARYKEAHSVSPWKHTLDSPPDKLKYRCHWTAPIAIDPFDHNSVYYGCQVIFRTTDAGATWSEVSPDLSTGNPAHIAPSGGIVGDNLGQFYGGVVFAIAPSKIQKGLIWAGTNDGQIWLTQDAAAHWSNVSQHLPGLPAAGTITSIAPSSFDAGSAYVAIDLHLIDNRDPFIYKTTDFGKTWKRISGDLPKHELSYVRTITDDPNSAGLLFAGTGNGLFYSLDEGSHWIQIKTGLPPAPVTWAVVQPTFHDLVVSTYGRGLYILDDITPLEQMVKHRADAAVVLFEPRAAYRFVRGPSAMLNFALKSVPENPIQFEILDSQGAVIRKLKPEEPKDLVVGLNRVEWDLRYDSPRVVAMRTVAPDNPQVWDEPRFRDTDTRHVTHWGSEPAEVGPIAAPGAYSVRLKVDGQTFTQPLTILSDPHAPGSAADIEASVKTLVRIRDDISHVSDLVNRIEWLRKQIEVIEAMLRPAKEEDKPEPPLAEEDDDYDAHPSKAPAAELTEAQQQQKKELLKTTEDFDKQLEGVESRLVSQALRNSDDKYFVESYGTYLDLIWLNAEVGTGGGDVAGSADFAPRATQLDLLKTYEEQAQSADSDFEAILHDKLPQLNQALNRAELAPLLMESGNQ